MHAWNEAGPDFWHIDTLHHQHRPLGLQLGCDAHKAQVFKRHVATACYCHFLGAAEERFVGCTSLPHQFAQRWTGVIHSNGEEQSGLEDCWQASLIGDSA